MPGPSLPAALAAVAVTLAALAPVAVAVVPAEPTSGASRPAAARTGAGDAGRDATRHLDRPAAAVDAPTPDPAAAVPSIPEGARGVARSAVGGRAAGPAAPGAGPATPLTSDRQAAPPGGPPPPGHGWQWPLLPAPTVVHRFDVGPFPWSPGHRGVDLAPPSGLGDGAPVRAAGPGVVRFAGVVAGRGVVSVDHGGGLRTTYEPVVASVHRGDAVRAGTVLGTLAGPGGHCAGGCLHWGALLDGRYVDPLSLLRPREPPVLLPLS